MAYVSYAVYKRIRLAAASVYNDISTDGMVYIKKKVLVDIKSKVSGADIFSLYLMAT